MGGRGTDYEAPSGGSGNSNYGTGPAPNIGTLKEQLGTKRTPIPLVRAYTDANPNYDPTGQFDAYNENCQRCVVAFELRRRGYDVTALPSYNNDTLPNVAYSRDGMRHGRWAGAFQGIKFESVGAKTSGEVYNNIIQKVRDAGPGSRFVVSMAYSSDPQNGHVFNIENRKGVVFAVDAQTGKRLWLNNFLKNAQTNNVTIARTDNARISDRAKNFVTSEKIYQYRERQK